jgi:hypothetical protein
MARHTRPTIGATFALLFVAFAAGAMAHHGWTGYDDKTPVTATGTVKTSGYENPHGFADLETPGKVWHVILAPPSRMENRGLSREMLKPGTQATVTGYPSKSDQAEMRAERITIGEKTIELR